MDCSMELRHGLQSPEKSGAAANHNSALFQGPRFLMEKVDS